MKIFIVAVTVCAMLCVSACHRNSASGAATTPEAKRANIQATFTDTTDATLRALMNDVSHLKNMGVYQQWVWPQATAGKWHCSALVKITNKGNAAGFCNPAKLRLTVRHQVFEPVQLPIQGALPLEGATLQPGATVSGTVFFQMPSACLESVKRGEADISLDGESDI